MRIWPLKLALKTPRLHAEELYLGSGLGTQVTATAAELNAIAGGGLSAAELAVLDGVVAGTVLANKAVIAGANKHIDALAITDGGLALGAGAGTAVTSTAAELNILDGATLDVNELNVLDGAVAGTAVASKALVLDAAKVNDGVVVAIRANHLAAAIIASTAVALPDVAGKSFCVMDIRMRAVGGNVSGPTTVEVVEETSGKVFLSHVTADLLSGVWHDTKTGTPVITGITGGGLVVAGKKLLVTDTGGTDFATATSLDTIVVGYYTTT